MTRIRQLDFTPEEKARLRTYWEFAAPHRSALFLQALGAAEPAMEVETELRIERQAIFEDAWAAFAERLAERGRALAASGTEFSAWLQRARDVRDRELALLNAQPSPQRDEIAAGLLLLFDIRIEILGRGYFQAKEQLLRRSEEQLQHSQKLDAIGRLASGIAHDFYNVLTVVQSYACMLEDSHDVGDERRTDAGEIRKASERAQVLTRQLLTLSRQGGSSPVPVDTQAIVEAFAPTLRRLVGSGIQLDLQLGKTPPVLIDPGHLEQVIMNLTVNARDALNGAGKLTIDTSCVHLDDESAQLHGLTPGRYVLISVTDNGPGISRDIQAKIFEPFFTTKDASKGTGLGLSIVQGILQQAKSHIEVYSAAGHGTTFRIRIPVTTTDVSEQVIDEPRVERTLLPVTVLCVDAYDDVRQLVTRILGDAGCTVLTAANGDHARACCVKHEGTIDVALIDVALSDGRGDLLVRDLRDLRPELAVVLTSGFPVSALGTAGDVPSVLLSKPFTPTQLRDAIALATVESPARARKSEPTLQPRVLVVDDDPSLRKMLVRMLKRAAFDVTEVESGKSALAALSNKRFDVVLSDIHMPDGDGLDLLRSVRRIDLDIPVILMSGKPDVQTAASAIEFGAFRYLTKPLDIDVVERLVRSAARAHALARLRREAARIGSAGNVGAADRAGLEVRFDQALERIWMAFQPIVEAGSGKLYGVEALVRSREPSIPTPPALLDTATQLGRMPQLGRRVRQLSAAALQPRADIPQLFVNLHPTDLFDVNLIDEDAPLTAIASRVILEVTERESLDTTTELVGRLERLRALGFRIAVDDIGAGYSGLTSFTDLTPEIVKIDMSLVRSIHTSTVKQRTVGALCSLCHEMGTLVVGEGVETADERACLESLGCDLLQGYLIAKPAADLPALPD
jgi:EAL domain-containing protein (putative c-di-GMP-specific phosphodiesterase class I)/signal transduction histidine kinase/FixJ family two-component response regulator